MYLDNYKRRGAEFILGPRRLIERITLDANKMAAPGRAGNPSLFHNGINPITMCAASSQLAKHPTLVSGRDSLTQKGKKTT
jgi:hypothetical protein